ncbi:hypothetical protein [Streptomyces zaomyceticus]|uniref:hypothetical protein n=1 Tax=Streptomyces zaomyceticus TaxID=68286 RepID=UPI0034257F69
MDGKRAEELLDLGGRLGSCAWTAAGSSGQVEGDTGDALGGFTGEGPSMIAVSGVGMNSPVPAKVSRSV